MIIKSFSKCQKSDTVTDPEIGCGKTGEIRSVERAYKNILHLRESYHSLLYENVKKYEYDICFLIRHHLFIECKALFYIMPVILKCYICLETRGQGESDATVPFYPLLIRYKYSNTGDICWSEKQEKAVCLSLEYVYEQFLKRGIFDGTLFCTLILFSDDLSFADSLFHINDAGLVRQIRSFLENDILFWNERGVYNSDTLISAIMYYSGAVQCTDDLVRKKVMTHDDAEFLSEHLTSKDTVRNRITGERKELVFRYLPEDRITDYLFSKWQENLCNL